MPITRTTYGSAQNKTAATTVVFNTTATIPAGTLLVIGICADNTNASNPTISSITAVGGGTWTARAGSTSQSGASGTAGSGIFVYCQTLFTTSSVASGTAITVTFSTSPVAKAVALWGLSDMTNTLRNTVVSATSTNGLASATTSGTALVAGDVVIGVSGAENAALIGSDPDTVNGAWEKADGIFTTGGSPNTNTVIGMQFKTVIGTGAQTFNPTSLSDQVSIVFAMVPAPFIPANPSDSVGLTDSITAVGPTYPKVETLTDDFSTDLSKWPGTYGTVVLESGQAKITTSDGYPALWTSPDQYSLVDSSAFCKMAMPNAAGGGGREMVFEVRLSDNTDKIYWYCTGTELVAAYRQGGVINNVLSLPYNPVQMLWLRILHRTPDTVEWSTSPDGLNWTLFTSSPVGFNPNACQVVITCGWYLPDSPWDVYVDNFNVAPAGGQALSFSVGDPVVLTDSVATVVARALTVSVGDQVGVTDSATKDAAVSVSDRAGVADSISGAGQGAVGVGDTVAVTDTLSRAVGRAVSDQVGLTDSVAIGLGRALTVSVTDPVWSGQSFEPFTTYPVEEWAEGTVHGAYRAVFNSFGPHGVIDDTGNRVIRQQPEYVEGDTRASLSVSTASYKDVDVTMRMKTVSQNRPTAPNTWERAWAVAAYVNNDWFYYVALKTNGLEVGKRDPAYPGGQRFLPWYQGTNWPLGAWHKVRIKLTEVPTGTKIQVWVDDVLQGANAGAVDDGFVDEERPLNLGAIGFYNEDALVHFDDVAVGVPGMADTVTTSIGRSLADQVAVTDSVSFTLSRALVLSDTVGVTDSTAKSSALSRVDTAGVTDSISGAGQGATAQWDVVGVTDTVATVAGYVRGLVDAEGITDTVAVSLLKTVGAVDPIGVTDSVDRAVAKGAVDLVGITDTVVFSKSVSLTDTVGVTDSEAEQVNKAVGDTVGVTDSLLRQMQAFFSDLAGVDDSVATTKSAPGNFGDFIGISDYASTIVPYARTYSDREDLTDSVQRLLSRPFTDVEGVTDSIVRQVTGTRIDPVLLTDSVTTLLIGVSAGRPKVWTGTAYVEKPGKVWTGSGWVEKPWKTWDGTKWEV